MRGITAAALLAVALACVAAPAGARSDSCKGTLVESQPMKGDKGKKIGELDVYYDSATGKNCAKLNHAGRTWGKRLKTRVWIGICSETTPNDHTCHYDPKTDSRQVGPFKYFAGPVTTKKSAAGHCITATGDIWTKNGKKHSVSTHPWAGHCR